MEESPQRMPAQQQSVNAPRSDMGGLDESIRGALQALTQLLGQQEAIQQTGVAGAGEGPGSDTTRAEREHKGEQKGSAHRAALETRDGGYIVADQPNGGHTFTIQAVTGETVEVGGTDEPIDLVSFAAAITQGVLEGVARAKEARVQAAGGDVSAAAAAAASWEEFLGPITMGIAPRTIGLFSVQFGQSSEDATE